MNEADAVKKFVAAKLRWLSETDSNGALGGGKKAALARLRRGVGKEAGTVPDIWQYVYESLPDILAGDTGKALRAQNAIHTALTLYAMHSQGIGNAHSENAGSLGNAAKSLKMQNPDNEPGIKRRFDALATAKTPMEISNHSRGIIQLLRQGKVMLNYADFAKDLYWLESNREFARQVLRNWGKDFYRVNNIDENKGDSDEQ
ncbi:MAG: type I-E CRISPR-associated protein Cse2/CasB [Clostridiales Family XIII bacterium]|jgi:CRISPR system Cascade subunit CasB|nr:type I-E CRISPR-associated protein Cse2/CasB [Clostridiales Family XIII bacterium]